MNQYAFKDSEDGEVARMTGEKIGEGLAEEVSCLGEGGSSRTEGEEELKNSSHYNAIFAGTIAQ